MKIIDYEDIKPIQRQLERIDYYFKDLEQISNFRKQCRLFELHDYEILDKIDNETCVYHTNFTKYFIEQLDKIITDRHSFLSSNQNKTNTQVLDKEWERLKFSYNMFNLEERKQLNSAFYYLMELIVLFKDEKIPYKGNFNINKFENTNTYFQIFFTELEKERILKDIEFLNYVLNNRNLIIGVEHKDLLFDIKFMLLCLLKSHICELEIYLRYTANFCSVVSLNNIPLYFDNLEKMENDLCQFFSINIYYYNHEKLDRIKIDWFRTNLCTKLREEFDKINSQYKDDKHHKLIKSICNTFKNKINSLNVSYVDLEEKLNAIKIREDKEHIIEFKAEKDEINYISNLLRMFYDFGLEQPTIIQKQYETCIQKLKKYKNDFKQCLILKRKSSARQLIDELKKFNCLDNFLKDLNIKNYKGK